MNERQLRAFWNRFGQHLAPDNGSGGGAGGTGDGSQGAGNAGDNGNGSQGNAGKVTFTTEQQAEIDRIIAERIKRAETSAGKKAVEARAKELGYETVEAMEAALKAQKDAADKEKTDLEKEKAARVKAEADLKAATESVKKTRIDTAIQLAAQEAKAVDPAEVLLLIDRSSIELTEAGEVKGAKEAVEALKKKKAHLFTKPETGSPGAGFRGGNQGGNDMVNSILERQGLKRPDAGSQQQQQTQVPKSSFWRS